MPPQRGLYHRVAFGVRLLHRQNVLFQLLLMCLLISDVLADHLFIKATVLTQYPRAQKWYPVRFLPFPRYRRCIRMADLPFNRPTAWATPYFGRMLKHMWI